jgi:hypothetical protein
LVEGSCGRLDDRLRSGGVHLRWKQRLGQMEIAARPGVPASTVYSVLRRCRTNRLSHIDRRPPLSPSCRVRA